MTSTDKSGSPQSRGGAGKKSSGKDAGKPQPTGAEAGTETPERIAKILARAGVASRRDAERMIMDGRVRVNGALLETPAVTVRLSDRIEVDGAPIRGIERTRLWLYYKPIGLVTTNSDPDGRPTVFDNLPADLPRVLSIGRLDINTEGLLLLTNDGGLARVLELPTTGWLRRYRVRAHGTIDQAALDRLKDGIAVDGVLYGAIEATLDRVQGSNVWITMGLREGKNREIKNVLGALGLSVNRLIRISYGPLQLADLGEGEVREIRGRTLRDQLGPRMIADAHANFDAPVFTPGDAGEVPVPQEEPAAERGVHKPARKGGKESRGEKRDRALSRLDTKADDRSAKKAGDKRRPPHVSRTTNVWMAPGARPVAPKKAKEAAEKAEKSGSRSAERPKPRSGKPSRGKAGDRTFTKSAKRPGAGKSVAAAGDARRGTGKLSGVAKQTEKGTDDRSSRRKPEGRPTREASDKRPTRGKPGERSSRSGNKPRGPRDADRRR